MDITLRRCDMPHPEGAARAGDAIRREFSIDGDWYDIDLCARHDDAMSDMADPWIAHADRVPYAGPPAKIRRTAAMRRQSSAARAWAIEEGLMSNKNGRLPAGVMHAWQKRSAS